MAHKGRPWTDYKPPTSAPVWGAIEGLARYYILVAALELDVFDTLQRIGPSPVEAVAEAIGAPIDHTRSLLDGVVALQLLDQFTDVYELNDAAKRYLVSDGPATMADLIGVAPGPHENWTRLADTVRNGRQPRSRMIRRRSTCPWSREHSRRCSDAHPVRISSSAIRP